MAAEGRWRDLPPVIEEVKLPERLGVTFLRTHDRCDRSAFLDLKHEGGVGSAEMNRGNVFHRFAAKGLNHLVEEDETKLDPITAKDLLLEVYAESPDLTVPAAERDALRAMAWNFAEGTYFTPSQIIGVEQYVTLTLGEFVVSGRIDLIEQPHFARLDVTDWKTSFAMPTEAAFEGDFQTNLYALMLAFGEIEGGFRLGADVEEFGLRQVFPRYLQSDGLAQRFALVSRQELTDLRLDLEQQIARLAKSVETGRWPATPGPQCAECVAPDECPLPRHLRPESQMAVASPAAAAKLAEWWYVQDRRVKRAKAAVKAWANANGRPMVPIGDDLVLKFEDREEYSKLDRETVIAEIEGAIEFGQRPDLDSYRRKTTSVRFEVRKRD